MAKTNLDHHLYPDKASGILYFQKKVRGIDKPYKLSLGTTSVVEARRRRDEYLEEIRIYGRIRETESIPQEALRFGEVALKWAEIKETKVEETTFDAYRKIMNAHILPHFGNKCIDNITSLDIESFISKLKCKGKTKRNILTPLRDVMKFAKTHKIIQTNPMIDVEPIKSKKSEMTEKQPLSLDEIRQFLVHVDDFWKPLFIFLFFTGVRISEAAGLKWKRVHLDKGIVQIHRNLVFANGKRIYKSTKNEGSYRDVKLSKMVIDALREQRKRTWKGDRENFVFLNRAGRNIHRHTLNKNVIKPTLLKAGISANRSVKETRASYITNSLDSTERMSFIKNQVGHVNTRMIVEHYYRTIPADEDGKKLEEAWNSTRILPEQDGPDLEVTENTE